MRNYPEIGVLVNEILLPEKSVDLQKWAVIACDQFTSQPEYWQKVREIVGDAPSTLNMILPEVFLGTSEETARIQSSQQAMNAYLQEKLLVPYEGMILVERTVDGKTRKGLMLALDLERYDFNPGSQTLIRATEGTIIERLPPRIRIREGAPLELPHILVLIDDPQRTVIEPLLEARDSLTPLYETDLMLGSGHLRGSLVSDLEQEKRIVDALRKLADPQRFLEHYGVESNKGVLLFAMGDGNHSLATARAIWEKIRMNSLLDHPARFALVEVENVHDEGLAFEPIHRVLFGVRQDWKSALQAAFGERVQWNSAANPQEMMERVHHPHSAEQVFGVVSEQGAWVVTVQNPPSNLAAGTLQGFLDAWLGQGGARHIDYVHGDDVFAQLGSQPGNLGFYLPTMDKNDLFKTVILDGSLPRKTFSLGEAHQKRFYMESRRISQ